MNWTFSTASTAEAGLLPLRSTKPSSNLDWYSLCSPSFQDVPIKRKPRNKNDAADATFLELGQRTGWERADEVAGTCEVDILHAGDTARTIASHLDRVRLRLDAVHASSFPKTVIHGDFIAQNLLFQGEKLSGVIDFDSVHRDLRAADVACARRSRL